MHEALANQVINVLLKSMIVVIISRACRLDRKDFYAIELLNQK